MKKETFREDKTTISPPTKSDQQNPFLPSTEETEDEKMRRGFLFWRHLDDPNVKVCSKCSGSGIVTYPNTSMYMGGIGGQSLTDGPCDICWGSGDENRPWINIRELVKSRMEDT